MEEEKKKGKRRRRPSPLEPTPEERAAVDAAVGRAARRGHDLALPLLQAVQAELGWLPPGATAYLSRQSGIPVSDLNSVASFYDLLSTQPQERRVIRVCDDIICSLQGRARALLQSVQGTPGASVHASPCLGACHMAPALWDNTVEQPPAAAVLPPPGPFGRHLLRRLGKREPYAWEAYRQARAMGGPAVIEALKAAKLVGRGGAAFPTGIKWEGVAKEAATPKYVVVNADESEPGTFKDRLLLEEDPHPVIEAVAIAALAVGAAHGYVYIRGEYPRAIRSVEAALEDARRAGVLGEHFDIEVRAGAGAYVCGEETALFASIEGYQGQPRVKPPFPAQHGLFGKPTLINNVETFACVPLILQRGPEWFQQHVPKLVCVSGDVARPGVHEVPLGIPLRQLIDEYAGGVTGGRLQAVLIGGAAGTFLPPDQLDLPLDPRSVTLGSGAVMVFNEGADLWRLAGRVARFFAEESCGKCVPCRLGTARQEKLVERIAHGHGGQGEADLLLDLVPAMADASICGLGQTAGSAVTSLLRHFGLPHR